jgi:SAM-dependent methyltransferase
MNVIARIKQRLSPSPPTPDLDTSYKGMYAAHAQTHAGVAKEMAEVRDREKLGDRLLEIACGSGHNIENLIGSGFDYVGCDISETAIALAMQKHPGGRFLNLAGADMSLLRDGCFDVVYCSAMLEHVGEHAELLSEMIRLARRHLFVMFYEGLPDAETKIEFHPHEEAWPPSIFGVKFIDYQASNKGWYMNRYSRTEISAIVAGQPIAGFEILDRSNRDYFAGCDSILHVRK